VVSKLEWAKIGASERQLEDVAGILRDTETALDERYIEEWVRELELEVQWKRARERRAYMTIEPLGSSH